MDILSLTVAIVNTVDLQISKSGHDESLDTYDKEKNCEKFLYIHYNYDILPILNFKSI